MTKHVRAELRLSLRALKAARCHEYRSYLGASGELSSALEYERAVLNAQIARLSGLLRNHRETSRSAA